MKTPKATRLPSGMWYCRVRTNGQDISITRQTEKDAVAAAMAVKAGIIKGQKSGQRKTLEQAIDDYIDARQKVLSPSTICGYRTIQKTRFAAAMHLQVSTLTAERLQRMVNQEAYLCGAKTLKNAWSLIAAAIEAETGARPTVRLKQIVKQERAYLTPEQIRVFLAAIRGRSFEVAALLALSSLRRSEILDLQWRDVDFDAGVIHVRGAAVYDEHWQLVHKAENKNRSSRRDVPMIQPLRVALSEAERKSEYVVPLNPSYLYEGINEVCERNGLPRVGVHGLRHSFASLAYHLNIPERIAMRIGGWANAATMHEIYTHLAASDVAKSAAALLQYFEPEQNDDDFADEKPQDE